MMNEKLLKDSLQKRDRTIVVLGLAGISLLSWTYMFSIALRDKGMDMGMEMMEPHIHAWDSLNLFLTFVMWAVMMVAMMIPSASPLILLFATINRDRSKEQDLFVSTAAFVAGYLVAWTVFSAFAALAQWGLQSASLLSHMLVINSPVLGGSLLFVAGVFQWSPLKYACLTRCRSPLGFLMNEWREGTRGALIMGLIHGMYCIGCCWLLMILLFVTGVMSLLWMAIITIFILLEKIVPGGYWVSRIAGILLITWGICVAGGAFF